MCEAKREVVFTVSRKDILDIVAEARYPVHKRLMIHVHFDVHVDREGEVKNGFLELSLLQPMAEGWNGEVECPCREYFPPFVSVNIPYDPFTDTEDVLARLRKSLTKKVEGWAIRHGWTGSRPFRLEIV